METSQPIHDLAEKLSKELIAKGLLLEAGFAIHSALTLPENLPPEQLALYRDAFFSGAHHLYATMMNVLDPGMEPTRADLKRMELIHNEQERWLKDFTVRTSIGKKGTRGSA